MERQALDSRRGHAVSGWHDKPHGRGWHWYLAPGEPPALHAIASAFGENGETIFLACEPFAPRERMGARDISRWPGKWAAAEPPKAEPANVTEARKRAEAELAMRMKLADGFKPEPSE